jgi:hypothetical protein
MFIAFGIPSKMCVRVNKKMVSEKKLLKIIEELKSHFKT